MTFKIYTLGCKVNIYESRVMEESLLKKGYTKSENPDICIVNTCTVTNTADNKSAKLIRKLKRTFPKSLLIVTGCLVQNRKEKIKELGVDIAFGNKNKTKILEYIEKYKNTPILDVVSLENVPFECMELNNFNLTRAYIKIEDGCNNYCSYCIIPYVRGDVRSKGFHEVLSEAKALIKNGHREIVLTGIHTGHYYYQTYDFSDLLRELVKLENLERLRISSIEITELSDKFLKILEDSKILVDHMHIPLQSGSDTILKLMNRKYDIEYFKEKIEKIRNIRPNISISTDVIVGFPGETEKLFQETIETIKKIKFTKLHVFPYSNRKGTKADNMPNQIPNEIKKQRVRRLIDLSKDLEIEYMEKQLGRIVDFLPEEELENSVVGHSGNFLLIKAQHCQLNKIIKVKLNCISYPYMEGEIIDESMN